MTLEPQPPSSHPPSEHTCSSPGVAGRQRTLHVPLPDLGHLEQRRVQPGPVGVTGVELGALGRRGAPSVLLEEDPPPGDALTELDMP